MLERTFHDALSRSGVPVPIVERLWQEIATAHSERGRHYHTLDHLEHMVRVLQAHWSRLQDPDAIVFAIAYHDIVYRVTRADNEEKSAELMRERLTPLGVPASTVDRAFAHILATKAHTATDDPDTAYFTDADLSILGASPADHARYTKAIRREYRRYPDLLYKPGRRKVLQHFLNMPRIYRTEVFHAQLETAARRNLQAELIALGGGR